MTRVRRLIVTRVSGADLANRGYPEQIAKSDGAKFLNFRTVNSVGRFLLCSLLFRSSLEIAQPLFGFWERVIQEASGGTVLVGREDCAFGE